MMPLSSCRSRTLQPVVVGERRSEQRIQVVVAARVDRVADPPYEREVVAVTS